MVLLAALFRTVFLTISTLTNILSRAILTATAHLFILLLRAFRVPGEATKGILEQLTGALKSVVESLIVLVIDVVRGVVSGVVDKVKDGIVEFVMSTSSAVGVLVESMRESLEGLMEEMMEIIEGLSEMIFTMLGDAWRNCLDALSFVKEKVDD